MRSPIYRKRINLPHEELDLRGLVLAVVVAQSGSIRLASLQVGLTASALSRRISALEDVLGVSLFERRSSGVRTTDAGARFLDAAARMLLEIDQAAGQAREAGAASVGRLVIGTYYSVSTGRLRDALLQFIQQNPRVTTSVMEASRQELTTAVRQGKADLAVLLSSIAEPSLEMMVLWRESWMVALPEKHRLAEFDMVQWTDLAAETFVVASRGSGPEVRERIQGHLPESSMARFLEQDVGREGMFNLVGTGLGVAALAESASGVAYPGVRFRPVGDAHGPTMVEAAAYYDPKRDNPVLRRFLSTLRAIQRSGSSPSVVN